MDVPTWPAGVVGSPPDASSVPLLRYEEESRPPASPRVEGGVLKKARYNMTHQTEAGSSLEHHANRKFRIAVASSVVSLFSSRRSDDDGFRGSSEEDEEQEEALLSKRSSSPAVRSNNGHKEKAREERTQASSVGAQRPTANRVPHEWGDSVVGKHIAGCAVQQQPTE
eukprot:4245346-Pyramimonas_sp.AAC.1